MIANNVLYYLFDALFTNYRNKIWNFLLGFGYGSKWGSSFINYVSWNMCKRLTLMLNYNKKEIQ